MISAIPFSAACACAPAFTIAFSCVQVSPERYHSTGTGPETGGMKSPKVISPPTASEQCR